MLNISQSEMELRRLQSNEFSPQNSVDQIIRKYTEKRSERFPINNTNTPSKNESYMISTKIDTSKDRAINSEFKDNTLFNFITNYKPEDIKNEYNLNQYDKHSRHSNVAEERSHKKCIDKSTHCRPVLNLYNEGFIFKTLEENVKLTSIVKRLFYAHQREKEHEAWKNFINLLKNKHKQDDNSHINKNIPNFLEREYDSERLEDYYITKFKSRQSNTYKTLLDDIYRNSDEIDNSRNLCDSKIVHQRESHTPYRRYSVCYPTSSLGRLTVLQREKERLARIEKHEKSLKENRNKKIQNKYLKKSDTLDFYQPESICSVLKSEIVQTESVANKSSKTKNNRKIYKNYRCEQNTQTLEPTNDNVKNIPLKEIENKLETLINSINGLIDEFKKKRKVKIESKNNGLSKHFDGLNSIIVSNDDEKKLKESRKKYYSSSENALPRDTFNLFFDNCNSDVTKLNDIFSKQLGDNLSSNRTCSVQITFEVPTRERSTEVTKSLSKAGDLWRPRIEEMNMPREHGNEQITIAVNTDPLSILTLLRISTQAMKGLLSYMPNIDYYYYLSKLYVPQLPSAENTFVCNICKAKFSKASDLSDHIQAHDLGKVKNCCLCRHILNLRRPNNVYSCRHCGQCFTRAYCCQLHQEECAKRFTKHVTNSNLLILR